MGHSLNVHLRSEPLRHRPEVCESRRTALLAIDDDELRGAMNAALEAEGARVLEVADGLELLDYLEEGLLSAPPEIIVAEARMPGADGVALLSTLRAWDRSALIVLVVGEDDQESYSIADSAGADLVVERPVDSTWLAEMIDLLAP